MLIATPGDASSDPPPTRPARTLAAEVGWPVLLGFVGLMAAHGAMLTSGLGRIQADGADARLVHYLLEHSWRWVCQEPLHRAFWNAPFFYPATNTTALSDALVGGLLPYGMARGAGLSPLASYGVWLLTVSVLNYAGAFLWLRVGLMFPPLASAAGAYLFAFAAPRMNQIRHPQLWPQAYTLLSLFALTCLFGPRRPARPWGRLACWLVAAMGMVGQFYTAFYLGAFTGLAMAVALVVALCLPASRARLLAVLWADLPWIAMAAVASLAAMQPFLVHYLAASREVGPRWWPGVRWSIPLLESWIQVGPNHVLYGTTLGRLPLTPAMFDPERRLGLGILTPLACLAGLWLGRSREALRLAGLTVAGLVLLTTRLPVSSRTLDTVACVVAAAGLGILERSGPAWARGRTVAMTAMLVLLWFEPMFDVYVLFLVILTWTLCALRLATGGSAETEDRRTAALGTIGFSLGMITPFVLATAAGLAMLVLVPAEILRWPHRSRWRSAALLVGLAFAVGVTFADRPVAPLLGVAVAILIRLLPIAERPRIATRSVVVGAVVASLVVLRLYNGTDTLWSWVYDWVPGGSAIRAVGRVILVILVPAAAGFAALLASPVMQRRRAWAALLIAFCAAEQLVRTIADDGREAHAHVAALARQIDPSHAAFYTHPASGEPFAFDVYQVDAMWAGMLRGVPTVNGYTGGYPRGWDTLYRIDFESDGLTADQALRTWLDQRQIDPGTVQVLQHPARP